MRISLIQESIFALEKSEKIYITSGYIESIKRPERSRNVSITSMICESARPGGTGNCV